MSRNIKKLTVAHSEELEPGKSKLINVEGINIALFNVDGKLYGFQNECPHMGAPMLYGNITGTMLPCEPHTYEYGCDHEILRCPWHGWEFDMNTGRSLYDSKKGSRIRTFKVMRENDSIIVYI